MKRADDSLVLPESGTAKLFGQRVLEHDPARGWVRIEFRGDSSLTNPSGFLQGGVLAAMLDDAMGPAVWSKTNGTQFPVTIDMTVSFLTAARPGLLVAEARVVSLGKVIAFLEGELRDDKGTLIVRASASARLVAPKMRGPESFEPAPQ